MTGPRDSIIGFSLETVLPRFTRHLPTRFHVADGPVRFNAVVITADRGHRARDLDRAGAAPDRGLTWGRGYTYILASDDRARRSSASSVRPHRARRSSRWPWRGGCRSRSWSPTRARCTAAWTSARQSPMPRRGPRSRTTWSTWSIPTSRSAWPQWVERGAAADPRGRGTWAAADARGRHRPVRRGARGRPRLRRPAMVAGGPPATDRASSRSMGSGRSWRGCGASTRRPPRASTCATRAACCGRSSASRRRRGASRPPRTVAGRVGWSALSRPRDILYRRIDERARWLFDAVACSTRCAGCSRPATARSLRPMTGHGYGEAAALPGGGVDAGGGDRASPRAARGSTRSAS